MSHGLRLLVLASALVLRPNVLDAAVLTPPHDPSNGIACLDCHALGAGPLGVLLPRDGTQEVICKSCHNPTGQAAAMSDVALHVVNGGATVVDCGSCHSPHYAQESVDTHPGGATVTNRSLIRADMSAYVASGLTNTVFQTRPQDFAFAEESPPWSGVCQSCHTETLFHTHEPGGDRSHNIATDCTTCHTHGGGFMAGAGQAHVTHLTTERGPKLSCSAGALGCHGASPPPLMSDGLPLSASGVCDACHSPGGSWDGVNDPVIGAKVSWPDGVYDEDTLEPGKEQWCAGCHDDEPSVIGGVAAPAVAGDLGAATPYGIGAGYYVTGHGAPALAQYPWTGGTVAGAGLGCDACHDLAATHVDGVARTYDKDAVPGAATDYTHGYRLAPVGGGDPLVVPRKNTCLETPVVKESDFALCLQCHDPGPFVDSASVVTNFRRAGAPDVNAHYLHLAIKNVCGPGPAFSSDWSYTGWDSRVSCVTCHNVHGSSQLSMVRDGKLVDREPGLEMLYYDDSVTFECGGPGAHDPTPTDVSLPASTGTVWNSGALAGTFCATCHGSCGFDALYLREAYDGVAPRIVEVFGSVGSPVLTVRFSEGVYAAAGASGALEPSDLVLTDLDDSRTVTGFAHTAGDPYALLTLSAPLDAAFDIGVDTVGAAAASIFDQSGLAMDVGPVVIVEDASAPTVSVGSPAKGATSVPATASISFTVSDGESGVDWTTITVSLAGSAGYARSYSVADTGVLSASGTPFAVQVTVSPDEPFGSLETITVTVGAQDLAGNGLSSPVWSFATMESGVPMTLVLHPAGLASNPGGYWTLPIVEQWETALDTADGDESYVTSPTGGPGAVFSMAMDDAGLTGATITSVTLRAAARYVSGWAPVPPCYSGNLAIGYTTGATTVWTGAKAVAGCSYTEVSSPTYFTDSDGGPLDATDLDNLVLSVRRLTAGGYPLRVTELVADVEYTP